MGGSSVRFFKDVAIWCVVFFLLGAPVLPLSRAGMTLISALVVSLTWPLSISVWATLLTGSLRRDRQLQPIMNTMVDFFVSPTAIPSNDSRIGEAVGNACHGGKKAYQEIYLTDSTSLETAQLIRCFILATVLFSGALFGQLDWQAAYQIWPYPSLSAYVVVSVALEVYNRVGAGAENVTFFAQKRCNAKGVVWET
ncbi:hypothetical protein JKF63_02159 [Porcisia hertigi]|uniref:Uncharacterized protein n=1 Tax=Porcisia hertigi TaxID=2761500 RepID=A0A836HL20_9TRYP|nr:hypothetical protein JKF63_02159 [Porcisia hertigi]